MISEDIAKWFRCCFCKYAQADFSNPYNFDKSTYRPGHDPEYRICLLTGGRVIPKVDGCWNCTNVSDLDRKRAIEAVMRQRMVSDDV